MNGSRSPVIRFGNGETKRFGVAGAMRVAAGGFDRSTGFSIIRLVETALSPVRFVEAVRELLRRLVGFVGGGGRDLIVGEVESVS